MLKATSYPDYLTGVIIAGSALMLLFQSVSMNRRGGRVVSVEQEMDNSAGWLREAWSRSGYASVRWRNGAPLPI